MVPERSTTLSRRTLLGTSVGVVAGGFLSGTLPSGVGARSQSSAGSSTAGPDWPLERYDPAGTGYNPDATGPTEAVREKWRTALDDFRGGDASPVLVDGTLYVAGGRVAALDADDGSVSFSHDGQYRGSPAFATAEAYTSETLVVAGERGYTGVNAAGGATFLGRQFGFERWRHTGDERGFGFFNAPFASTPVVADNTVYVANATADRLAAVDPSSGRERWGVTVGRDDRGGRPGRPAVLDGTVYVSYWPHNVAAHDAETGEQRWHSEVKEQTVLPPTATPEAVLAPDRTGVTALDPETGEELWRYDHGGNATEGAAAVAEGTVYLTAGHSFPTLHAVDLATGEEVWQTPDVAEKAIPVVADGVVYVSAPLTDELVAVDAETGEVRWRFETEYGVGVPAIGDGTLYLTGGYRDVYALEEER
jgi:outer membrane protein assembly factor BamB